MSSSKRPQWPDFSDQDTKMDVLVKLSQFYGNDPDFIVAGGGNTSAKIEGELYVKASGFSLATIGPEGFVAMDRAQLGDLLTQDLGSDPDVREAKYKDTIMASRTDPNSKLRPSVECVLHNIMPGAYVVHTHPTHGNALTCLQGGKELTEELFGDDVLWVEYVDPGFTLAKTIADALAAYQQRTGRDCPEAIMMQNHGMVVSGDTPDQVRQRTNQIVDAICKYIEATPGDDVFGPVSRVDASQADALVSTVTEQLAKLLGEGDAAKTVLFEDSELTMSLVGASQGEQVSQVGPMCPDQIVYCKSFPMWVEMSADQDVEQVLSQAIEAHVAKTRFAPYVVLVAGVGMFCVENDEKSARIVGEMYRSVIETMSYAQRLGGIHPMTDAQRLFIENWEAESYRKKVSAEG